MITDNEIEKAVDYLRNNARKAAQARAERIYMEEFRKTVKARVMRENEGMAIGTQEREAYASEKYVQHLDALKEAVEKDEYHRWMMAAAEAKIEAWRTQQANQRALEKIG